MEVARLRAKIDVPNRGEVLFGHGLKGHELDALADKSLCLVFADVSVYVPQHAAALEPECLHRHEALISESFEDLTQFRFLVVALEQIRVKVSVGKSEDLVEVVVLPLLQQLLLNLGEDLSAISLLKGGNALQSLANKVPKRVVEALPLHLNIVAYNRSGEVKLGAISHVSELAESLGEDTSPDLSKNSCLRRGAKAKIGCVDLAGDNSLWLLKFVVFQVPQIGHAVKLAQ